jgi:hypothetical protein
MIHDERCVRLQESGGAKLDHDADSAWSARRFELYNSRAFLFFAAILASVAVFFCLLFLLLRFSERCCFLFFALCSFSALVFFEVA